jgi:hypothetical protein
LTRRTTLLRRAVASATAAGIVLTGAVVLAVGAPAEAAIKKAETPFAYQGSAYGTRVTAGEPGQGGVSSGRTAWSVLGCTSMAPVRYSKGSNLTKVNANDFIQIGAVDSFTSTYRKPEEKHFGSRSVNKAANIILGPDTGPRLKIAALTTTANAFNKKGRYGATADVDLLGVDALNVSPDGSATPGPLADLLDAIDEGDDQLVETVITGAGSEGIDIPGLGTVYPAGKASTKVRSASAAAGAYGIRVALENGSQVNIGRAWSSITVADPAGVFVGDASGLDAVVGEGALGVGRTPFQNMPCRGTAGRWLTNPLASAPQNAQLNADVLKAEVYGKPFQDGRAIARSRASVADVTLGGGALEIKGIVGQVNVFQSRKGRVVRRTVEGTKVGAIIADGEPQELPTPGDPLEIPGLAKIEFGKRENLGKRGLRVHAIRVTLLDGTGLVLNIGTAKAKIVR